MINSDIRSDLPQVDLAQVFPESSIITLEPGTDHCVAITKLVDAIVASGRLSQLASESILAGLLEREKFSPSGLWRGFAMPHLRSRLITEMMGAVGIASSEIDFGSMDRVPVRTVFLVLSPFESRTMHLQVLGQLAAMFQDTVITAVLHSAKSGAEISRLWRLGKSSDSPV